MILRISGIVDGSRIELAEDPGLPSGTPVTVQIEPAANSIENRRRIIEALCGAWKDESLDDAFASIQREREKRAVRAVAKLDAPSCS